MGQESETVRKEPCLCGSGHVAIIHIYDDSDWGSRDHSWHGVFECHYCESRYAFVWQGRWAEIVRVEDKMRSHALLQRAEEIERALLASAEVGEVFDKVAAAFDALRSASERYRLAVQLGIETCSLSTFRKHTRQIKTRQWLANSRRIPHLKALFGHVGAATGCVDAVQDEVCSLRDQACATLSPVRRMGLTPIRTPLEGGNQ